MMIAITGATGFVGEALALEMCKKSFIVRLLSRSRPKICDEYSSAQYNFCDFQNIDLESLKLHLKGVSILYHCAAENSVDSRMEGVNVAGTSILVDAASGLIDHCVYVSTVGVYGTQKDGIITEETALKPMNTYEKTKSRAESIVMKASLGGGFSFTILRPSKVYGLKMRNMTLRLLASLIKKNLFFFIGKTEGAANYIHIDNLVDALVRCGTMDKAKNQIYNISEYCSLQDFIRIMSNALQKPMPTLRLPKSLIDRIVKLTSWVPYNPLTQDRVNALVKNARYSSEKIERELDYKHLVSMSEGISELICFYKK